MQKNYPEAGRKQEVRHIKIIVFFIQMLGTVVDAIVSLYSNKFERTIALFIGALLFVLDTLKMAVNAIEMTFAFQPLPNIPTLFINFYMKDIIFFVVINIIGGIVSLKVRK